MSGFVVRWLFAFILLAATYTPTQWNYLTWVMENGRENLSIAVLCGLVLAIGYIIHLRATMRSIGGIGMALLLGLVGAMLWVAYDLGWLNFGNQTANTWIGLIAISIALGIGLSWSHACRRLSG